MMNDEILRRADSVAARIGSSPSYVEDLPRFEQEMHALLAAVARVDARYAFDRDGRPGAIEAVRHALPAVERDLLDAVVEDHACELAAVREALYQVALAVRRGASAPPAGRKQG